MVPNGNRRVMVRSRPYQERKGETFVMLRDRRLYLKVASSAAKSQSLSGSMAWIRLERITDVIVWFMSSAIGFYCC